MGADRLDELASDRVQRIERRQRILEYCADVAPPHFAHHVVGTIVDAASRQANLAARDAPRRLDPADGCGAAPRFASAGLANAAAHLPRPIGDAPGPAGPE